MTHIAGLDGCKKGWIALYCAIEKSIIESCVVTSVEELFAAIDDLAVLAIDIPIGLTESGPRQCDVMARREIGPRASSVFPAPIRAVLEAMTYGEANRISRERQSHTSMRFFRSLTDGEAAGDLGASDSNPARRRKAPRIER
jgi:predicted RNase H-like nuclease